MPAEWRCGRLGFRPAGRAVDVGPLRQFGKLSRPFSKPSICVLSCGYDLAKRYRFEGICIAPDALSSP